MVIKLPMRSMFDRVYNDGIAGGVTSMDPFLKKFFPVVYRKKNEDSDSNYCKYDNQGLQLFTSSLYLAGLTSTFFASYTTRRLGRKLTMLIAGIFFIIGVVLNAAAQDLAMLIIGRILLGCGVGFANQVRSHGQLLMIPITSIGSSCDLPFSFFFGSCNSACCHILKNHESYIEFTTN